MEVCNLRSDEEVAVGMKMMVCSAAEAAILETLLAAQKTLAFLLMTGSLLNEVNAQPNFPGIIGPRFPFDELCRMKMPEPENKDASDADDDDDNDDDDNADDPDGDDDAGDEDFSGEEDDEEGDPEENPEANGKGGSDDEDEDDDDGGDDDDDDEDGDEDEEEDEDEEDQPPPKKRK